MPSDADKKRVVSRPLSPDHKRRKSFASAHDEAKVEPQEAGSTSQHPRRKTIFSNEPHQLNINSSPLVSDQDVTYNKDQNTSQIARASGAPSRQHLSAPVPVFLGRDPRSSRSNNVSPEPQQPPSSQGDKNTDLEELSKSSHSVWNIPIRSRPPPGASSASGPGAGSKPVSHTKDQHPTSHRELHSSTKAFKVSKKGREGRETRRTVKSKVGSAIGSTSQSLNVSSLSTMPEHGSPSPGEDSASSLEEIFETFTDVGCTNFLGSKVDSVFYKPDSAATKLAAKRGTLKQALVDESENNIERNLGAWTVCEPSRRTTKKVHGNDVHEELDQAHGDDNSINVDTDENVSPTSREAGPSSSQTSGAFTAMDRGPEDYELVPKTQGIDMNGSYTDKAEKTTHSLYEKSKQTCPFYLPPGQSQEPLAVFPVLPGRSRMQSRRPLGAQRSSESSGSLEPFPNIREDDLGYTSPRSVAAGHVIPSGSPCQEPDQPPNNGPRSITAGHVIPSGSPRQDPDQPTNNNPESPGDVSHTPRHTVVPSKANSQQGASSSKDKAAHGTDSGDIVSVDPKTLPSIYDGGIEGTSTPGSKEGEAGSSSPRRDKGKAPIRSDQGAESHQPSHHEESDKPNIDRSRPSNSAPDSSNEASAGPRLTRAELSSLSFGELNRLLVQQDLADQAQENRVAQIQSAQDREETQEKQGRQGRQETHENQEGREEEARRELDEAQRERQRTQQEAQQQQSETIVEWIDEAGEAGLKPRSSSDETTGCLPCLPFKALCRTRKPGKDGPISLRERLSRGDSLNETRLDAHRMITGSPAKLYRGSTPVLSVSPGRQPRETPSTNATLIENEVSDQVALDTVESPDMPTENASVTAPRQDSQSEPSRSKYSLDMSAPLPRSSGSS
ncbi:MAG: hypothetical protein Q9219_004634 [cf. Caloplaca sp. 3 TL-2023]